MRRRRTRNRWAHQAVVACIILLNAGSGDCQSDEVGRLYVDVSGSVDKSMQSVLLHLPELFLQAGIKRLEVYTFADARDSLKVPLFEFDLPLTNGETALCRKPTEKEQLLRTAHEAYLTECEEFRNSQDKKHNSDLGAVLSEIKAALASINFDQDRPSCINEAVSRAMSQEGISVVLTDGIVWGDGCTNDVEALRRLFGKTRSSQTIIGLSLAKGEKDLVGLIERIRRLRALFPDAKVMPAFSLLSDSSSQVPSQPGINS